MSKVAGGHFRRKREAPLILRGSTSQFRAIPGPEPSHNFCVFPGHAVGPAHPLAVGHPPGSGLTASGGCSYK
jgi:hypothetical protein